MKRVKWISISHNAKPDLKGQLIPSIYIRMEISSTFSHSKVHQNGYGTIAICRSKK